MPVGKPALCYPVTMLPIYAFIARYVASPRAQAWLPLTAPAPAFFSRRAPARFALDAVCGIFTDVWRRGAPDTGKFLPIFFVRTVAPASMDDAATSVSPSAGSAAHARAALLAAYAGSVVAPCAPGACLGFDACTGKDTQSYGGAWPLPVKRLRCARRRPRSASNARARPERQRRNRT